MCHCRFCQRATGGAYMVEPIFAADDFVVETGKPKQYVHVSEGSGKRINVHFCDVCGTKIFMSFERFADVIGLYGGTFDDPNWFEVAAGNSKHIFLDMARNGTVIPPGIATFRAHATQNDGTPEPSQVFDEPFTICQAS
jgi:hypothetical protein